MTSSERTRQITDAYRAAGGVGPCVLIRRAWVGPPPLDLVERQIDVYRSYATTAAQSHWEEDQLDGDPDGGHIAGALADVLSRTGADALNLRIHVPGVDPAAALEQIARLGDDVLPVLRKELLDR